MSLDDSTAEARVGLVMFGLAIINFFLIGTWNNHFVIHFLLEMNMMPIYDKGHPRLQQRDGCCWVLDMIWKGQWDAP